MAQCKLSPQEFVKNSFTPQVAVICSPKADEICRKNNLSFTELLQPFCKLGTDAHYKDPNGTVVSLKNFKISLQDINYRPPQPVMARKFLNSSVSDTTDSRIHTINIGEYTLQVPYSVPWFEAWRETFLQVQFPSEHEFTKHYVACMLVVSSVDENPLRTMVDLSQKISDMQVTSKLPKWFSNNVMRYYIIIHETWHPNHVNAVECFDALKISYGVHSCFLLRINSRCGDQNNDQLPDPWSQFISSNIHYSLDCTTPEASPSSSIVDLTSENNDKNVLTYHPLSPDGDNLSLNTEQEIDKINNKTGNVIHGACLSMEDVEQLKLLIHEFCTRALLPFVEKQVNNLNEYVINKKGVSRSLFSATKRWFTKPGSSGTSNAPIYYSDAAELQVRRLGDLHFMFGNYSMAFQAYHTAKRDFNADQAWLHYAGALEMAALSAFMANETSRKTLDYMEESINTYLNICKMAQFATRATLFSFECLKGRSLHGDAAHQLIRMTSEESDLRSALLLEQAAYCFLHSTKPTMVRKYAFHMVLAGHRFSKAAQRKHSLRCYKQAYQVYENKGWNLALDHIYCTIGKQANNLDLLQESVESYAKLFGEESRQSPQQQALFLKEYLTIHSILSKKQIGVFTQVLPLPQLNSDQTKVLVGPALPLRTPGKVPAMGITLVTEDDAVTSQRWQKLEEILVQEVQGSLPMLFKPSATLFTQESNWNLNPTAIVGEPIQVLVQLKNPLHILLLLRDIYLLWQYTDSRNKFVTNEITAAAAGQFVKTHRIKTTILQANSTQDIILTLTPLAVGQITLKAICYTLVCSNQTDEQVEVKGKQVFKMTEEKKKDKKDKLQDSKPDSRLNINVVPSAACLQVSFCEMNSELLRNELQQVSIELRNVGSIPLHKAYMATSAPHLLSSCDFSKDYRVFDDNMDTESPAAREKEGRKNHVTCLPLPNSQLEPGQFKNINIWIKAPDFTGPACIDLLIYYENLDPKSIPKYRLVRHIWNLSIQESVNVNVIAQRSCNSKSTEELTLSVMSTNMNKIHDPVDNEISILNAALLGDDWTLLNEIVAPNDIKLNSQESVHIFLKAQRKTNKSHSYNLISFIPQKQSMVYLNLAYLDFAKRNEQNRINIFDNVENVDKDKLKKSDAILIIRWQAHVIDSKGSKRTVYGQNQVQVYINRIEEEDDDSYEGPVGFFDSTRDDEVSISNKQEMEKLSLSQKQISYNLIHPIKVLHDFKSKKLCIIHVKMLLHSVVDTTVEVTVKTLETSSSNPLFNHRLSLFSPYSSKNFRWIQAGSVIKKLAPMNSDMIELTLAVLGPGTYDLGSHLEVWCQKENQPETAILQTCRIQSSIIVGLHDS